MISLLLPTLELEAAKPAIALAAAAAAAALAATTADFSRFRHLALRFWNHTWNRTAYS